ncbi:CBS domain-containing protein [Halorubellus sp. PRR65]|uniref:CBS domain-containing protein n=1 Tax=Halorubellus sp. PRR65 TaxID=3098148 RepID=UPI002B262DFD|nr:CBS domain-containing protein [Halorubellus sp. PRR65]
MTLDQIARDKGTLVTATPDHSIEDAAKLMAEHEVGSLVVERDDEPIGIITDRDVALGVVAAEKDPAGTTVADVMTREPVTVHVDDGVYELTETMRDNSIRRMPVVDDDGMLAGIATLDDVFVLVADEMHGLSEVIRAESPPY